MAILFDDADRFERLSRYVSGQMTDAEAETVEGDWTSNPLWIRDMELDARIQSGLGELRRTGQLESAIRGPWWAKPMRLLLLAASLAGVGIAVWIWQGAGHSVSPLLTSSPTLALGDSVAVMRLRQASQVSGVLELPREPRSIELRVMPDVTDTPANGLYSMSLVPATDRDAPAFAAADQLVLGKDGFVRAYVDAARLSAGRYRLLLRRADARDSDEFLIAVSNPVADQDAD